MEEGEYKEKRSVVRMGVKKVKRMIEEYMPDYHANRPMSVAEKATFDAQTLTEKRDKEKEEKIAKENREKAELKIQNAVIKFKDLNKLVSN